MSTLIHATYSSPNCVYLQQLWSKNFYSKVARLQSLDSVQCLAWRGAGPITTESERSPSMRRRYFQSHKLTSARFPPTHSSIHCSQRSPDPSQATFRGTAANEGGKKIPWTKFQLQSSPITTFLASLDLEEQVQLPWRTANALRVRKEALFGEASESQRFHIPFSGELPSPGHNNLTLPLAPRGWEIITPMHRKVIERTC